jgi:acyl-coenzyme A synthetase/AMP-(fatty) acid ligase/thioesterase domain-containing protein/aryl carrier-like protein
MSKNLQLTAELFAETVASFPEKTAISDGKTSVTFLELDRQIQQIAKGVNTLRARENFRGYVPIVTGRNVESAMLLLACDVNDIPYVPLDPDWNNERLKFVHETLGLPTFFLTTDENLRNLEDKLQGLAPALGLESLISLAREVAQDANSVETNLGYAIFTSGTTGIPKCVAYDLVGKRQKMQSRLRMNNFEGRIPPQEVLGTLSYPFFFTAGLARLKGIISGESLRLVTPDEMKVEKFIELVRELKPNRISGPPSLLILLANYSQALAEEPYLPTVREVTWGGDAVSYSTTIRLRRFFKPETRMESGYGATEATSPLKHTFTLGDSPTTGPMPLGKLEPRELDGLVPFEGMENHFVLMLEEPMAVGYLNNPELTSEKFITTSTGKRQWYSGDVVEVDQSGLVWHKGRVDDLVKIRGKLSSPSEATRALLSMRGVQDAVVLSVPRGADKQLVAHVELDPDSKLSSTELRRELARRLPAHLIPHKVMRHTAIPKTSRGKPDREAILALQHEEFRDKPIKPPINTLEGLLWDACCLVLSAQDLSVDDELVHLGMDSLAALQLEAILQEDLPRVSLDVIAQHKTIEQLAKYLARAPEGQSRQDGKLNESGEKTSAFAFPGAGNRVAHFVNLAQEIGRDQPLTVCRYVEDDPSQSNTSIRGRAERVFDKVLALDPNGPVKILGYSAGGVVAYELARMCASRGYRVDLTLFDPSIELMRQKGYSMRVKQNVKDSGSGLISALRKAFRRHGAARSLSVILIEKPSELLISRKPTREALRLLTLRLLGRYWGQYRRTVTELLVAEAIRSYDTAPVPQPMRELIRARYFYVSDNSRYKEWSKLLPGIQFFASSGKHEDMLLPPNVMQLGQKLRDEWGRDDGKKLT